MTSKNWPGGRDSRHPSLNPFHPPECACNGGPVEHEDLIGSLVPPASPPLVDHQSSSHGPGFAELAARFAAGTVALANTRRARDAARNELAAAEQALTEARRAHGLARVALEVAFERVGVQIEMPAQDDHDDDFVLSGPGTDP